MKSIDHISIEETLCSKRGIQCWFSGTRVVSISFRVWWPRRSASRLPATVRPDERQSLAFAVAADLDASTNSSRLTGWEGGFIDPAGPGRLNSLQRGGPHI